MKNIRSFVVVAAVLLFGFAGWAGLSATRHVGEAIKDCATDAPSRVLTVIRDSVFSKDESFDLNHEGAQIITASSDTIRQIALEIDKQLTAETGLTREEEREIGEMMHKEVIGKQYKILHAPRAERAMAELAAPLVKRTGRKGPAYRFFIIESDELNAFSHAGGYVYLTTAMLKFLKSDLEFQFILGHEIAHIELMHVLRLWVHLKQAHVVFGDDGGPVAMSAYGLISQLYDQENEFECDAWAYRTLRSLGNERGAVIQAPKRLLNWARENDLEKSEVRKPRTIAEAVVKEIDNHFRSHPLWAERVEKLEAMP